MPRSVAVDLEPYKAEILQLYKEANSSQKDIVELLRQRGINVPLRTIQRRLA